MILPKSSFFCSEISGLTCNAKSFRSTTDRELIADDTVLKQNTQIRSSKENIRRNNHGNADLREPLAMAAINNPVNPGRS